MSLKLSVQVTNIDVKGKKCFSDMQNDDDNEHI